MDAFLCPSNLRIVREKEKEEKREREREKRKEKRKIGKNKFVR